MARTNIWSLGMNQQPYAAGQRVSGCFDMRNIEVDTETGYPVLRAGYVSDPSEVLSRNGDQIFKTHFIGTEAREAFSRVYAIHERESWVHAHGRLFIAGVNTANRWINLRTGDVFPWSLSAPTFAPHIFGDDTERDLTSDDVKPENARVNRFSVCYTYYSNDFGIETPPSPATTFNILINPKKPSKTNLNVNLFIRAEDAPLWADVIRFYVQSDPFGAQNIPRRVADGLGNVEALDFVDSNIEGGIPGLQSNPAFLPDIEAGLDADGTPMSLDVSVVQDVGYNYHHVRSLGRSGQGATFPVDQHGNTATNLDLAFIYNKSNIPTLERLTETTGMEERTTEQLFYNARLHPNISTRILPIVWNEPPPRNFEHITSYAGRIWGYDRDSNAVLFSFIDGNGVSRWDTFPIENVAIPHSINMEGSHESAVTAISQIPGRGGLYVFYRDAIQTIRGQSLISGIFSTALPRTDLDASGGIPDFGTLSPKSIVTFRGSTIFLGSDRRIWQLVGEQQPVDIGAPVQEFIDNIPITRLDEVFAVGWDDKYIISGGNRQLIYDVQKKYWSSADLPIDSMYWSRGGIENESILYSYSNNQLYRLFEGNRDNGRDIGWRWESNLIRFDDIASVTGLYIHCSPPYRQLNYEVMVDSESIASGNFTPRYSNRFRQSVFGRGMRAKVVLSGQGEIPKIDSLELEYSGRR